MWGKSASLPRCAIGPRKKDLGQRSSERRPHRTSGKRARALSCAIGGRALGGVGKPKETYTAAASRPTFSLEIHGRAFRTRGLCAIGRRTCDASHRRWLHEGLHPSVQAIGEATAFNSPRDLLYHLQRLKSSAL